MSNEKGHVFQCSALKPASAAVWARPGPGWGPVRVGARSGLGPIWALMGPYGPIWALMGPYGPIWVLLDRSGHDQIRTFGRIWHVFFFAVLDSKEFFFFYDLAKNVVSTAALERSQTSSVRPAALYRSQISQLDARLKLGFHEVCPEIVCNNVRHTTLQVQKWYFDEMT